MSNSAPNPLGDHTGKRESQSARPSRVLGRTKIRRPPTVTPWLSSGAKGRAESHANNSARRTIIGARRLSRLDIKPIALEPNSNGVTALDQRSPQLSHLIGAAMPVLPSCICGSTADERYVCGWTIVYFYAGQPSDERPSDPEDIALHTAYSHHHYDLTAMRASVAGVSTEPADVQQERRTRCAIPHDLLSDPELRLAFALHLPTLELNGKVLYEPLALVMRDGIIHRAFYPIGDKPRHVGEVVVWIRICARG